MRLGLGHYRQNQNASSTTAATGVCITSGTSMVGRFIGSARHGQGTRRLIVPSEDIVTGAGHL